MPDFSPPPSPFAPDGSIVDPAAAELLAKLRDIHLPPAVSFWPLAPGWWMLIALAVALLVFAAYLEWRRRQTLGYRALQELKAIAQDEARYADPRAVATAAALLMRRIVLTRTGRRDAVALTGEGWQRFLMTGKAGLPAEVSAFIASAPYLPPDAPGGDAVARETVVAGVRRWIRGNA